MSPTARANVCSQRYRRPSRTSRSASGTTTPPDQETDAMPTGTTHTAGPASPADEPTVSRFDGSPMYQQIAAVLRHRIATGAYRAGDALPSGRTMAGEFATTDRTISSAINVLVNEGLLDQRPGHPTRVRAPHEHQRVPLRPGDTVLARMPSPQERSAAGIPRGVPVLVVGEHILPADRTVLVVGRLGQGEGE